MEKHSQTLFKFNLYQYFCKNWLPKEKTPTVHCTLTFTHRRDVSFSWRTDTYVRSEERADVNYRPVVGQWLSAWPGKRFDVTWLVLRLRVGTNCITLWFKGCSVWAADRPRRIMLIHVGEYKENVCFTSHLRVYSHRDGRTAWSSLVIYKLQSKASQMWHLRGFRWIGTCECWFSESVESGAEVQMKKTNVFGHCVASSVIV